MKTAFKALAAVAIAAAALGWWLSAPERVDSALFDGLTGDAARGEPVFIAAGCASCHHAPEAEDKRVLSGGQRFVSEFGTFLAPNISPHPETGIGAWSLEDFGNAVMKGVSPAGAHYYPAFPYTAYGRMTAQDVADLWAYMQTLPQDATPSQPHEVGFPFNIRRSVGLWKTLFVTPDWVIADAPERGRYLVEALAHCGECHSPRNAFGALDATRWMAGAPNPSGRGTIPALTPDKFDWSETDIAYYLETGFTPDFDSAGGHMAAVIRNFAKLPASDREAVAAYLKVLP